MRAWLRSELPVLAIEQPDDLWYLFSDPGAREVVTRRLEKEPQTPMYAYAVIRIRSSHIHLGTVRDPETDRGLYEFARWVQEQGEFALSDSGMPIEVAELIDPELYE